MNTPQPRASEMLMESRARVLTLPNVLTIGRVVMSLVVALLVILGGPTLFLAAFILFLVTAATDFLDGYLARKLNQTSELGVMLDPIADKILVLLVLLALAYAGSYSVADACAAGLIIFREVLISGMRDYFSKRGISLAVTWAGKIKTTVQLIATGGFILAGSLTEPGLIASLSSVLLWLAAALTLYSGADYSVKALRKITNNG